jgi:hypothetical protein
MLRLLVALLIGGLGLLPAVAAEKRAACEKEFEAPRSPIHSLLRMLG